MNSWLIWVVWGAFTFVAVLLGFVGRHFSLRTLRYVTAVTAAVLVVLVTRYGLTHPANPANASSDLANSFTQGADELSAAFFHPLLLVLPGSQVPQPGRIGWLVIGVLVVIGYRVLEAGAMRRQAPVLGTSALGDGQPNGAAGKAEDGVIDGQRYDQLVARLKFLLSAIEVRAPAILPGSSRSNGLASIAEASGVAGGGLAGAIIRFFGMLWPNPRRFQVRVRVESGHGGPRNTDSTKVTVSLDEPARGIASRLRPWPRTISMRPPQWWPASSLGTYSSRTRQHHRGVLALPTAATWLPCCWRSRNAYTPNPRRILTVLGASRSDISKK